MTLEHEQQPVPYHVVQPLLNNSEAVDVPITSDIRVSGIVINRGEGQDALGYTTLGDNLIVVGVADGFGIRTKPDSRQAAHMAVERTLSHFGNHPRVPVEKDELKHAVENTQKEVRAAVGRWGAASLTAGFLQRVDEKWFLSVVSVGDTRCYLVNDEGMRQLTRDDDDGGVSNAVGIDPVQFSVPEEQTFSVRPGDTVLFTTDGIHDAIQEGETGRFGKFTNEELTEIIKKTQDPKELAHQLTDASSSDLHTDASLLIVRIAA